MQRQKKTLSLLLIAAVAFVLPFATFAADTPVSVSGTVLEVQKYGNLTMDIKPKALYEAGYALGDFLNVTMGDTVLKVPFCTSYSDVDNGSLVIRDDQASNLLVIAINMGNFSTKYKAKAGDAVSFSLLEKKGYLSEYLLHQLKRTNVRSNYATDSIFANFRTIAVTGIQPAVLYRSSNPIDNGLGRAAYADELAKAAGIRTVLNLSDSDKEIQASFASPGFRSTYYKSLYDAGDVKALAMGVDLSAKDFGDKLAEGLRFLIQGEGPYLVHCTEGKDRAGFVSAVLESLMGAKLDEVVADYMTTYEDYYGVKPGSEQYATIANSNIVASLTTVVCGYAKGTDISTTDLSAAAANYLAGIGLASDEISALKERLSANSMYMAPNIAGTITQIEKYGHAVSDIQIADFNNAGFKFGDVVTVVFGNGFILEAPYLDGYYVNNGDPLVRAYPGQANIAVCVNYGKLNEIAKLNVGDKFSIMLTGPQEYLAQYAIRKLTRTNSRTDYPSDQAFANFRAIAMGTIGKGAAYRSSSPIDNQLGRASVADVLAKGAKVATIVDLADSADAIKTFLASKDFASPYYADLYKNGHVLLLNMGLAYASDEFKAGIVKGLAFMAENQGPYLVHCTEGKDRTGFFSALLGALMGASKDEIVADYMQSYVNFYNVKRGTDQYSLISQDLIGMLKVIAGTQDLDKADLAAGAKSYLLSGGLKAEQLEKLMRNLSLNLAFSLGGRTPGFASVGAEAEQAS
jgi:protein tyrosine/serine phosphatase/S-adenosylmethionine hydrolase